jgi:hypothetical protein
MFTIKELCKLRQAETEREMEAFFWSFGEFLESVCGARQWGKQKERQLISKATSIGTGEKLVTKSGEAFALLTYENYIAKSKKHGNIKDDEDEQHEEGEDEDEDEQHEEGEETAPSVPGKRKPQPRRSEESTQFTIMGLPSTVGGVKRAWRTLMSCTSWSR